MEGTDSSTMDRAAEEREQAAAETTWPRTPQGKLIPYQIAYEEDGVYLQLPSALPGIVSPTLVLSDVERRRVAGVRAGDLMARLRKGQERILLADAQKPISVSTGVFATISTDGMGASMVLLPPDHEGKELDAEELIALLHEKGITTGLDRDAIAGAVEKKCYYEECSVARGTPAQRGEDGRIVFYFETEHSPAPTILEDGSADFFNLNLYSTVLEGDLLVERILPGEGTPGVTVKGERIEPTPGAQVNLPKGKNVIISEDGNHMLAGIGGKADYVRNQVEVSSVYNIPGNVDMGVGNVDFVGDVEIKGSVIAGLTLKATGTVEINGTVEAATIIAGKDIVLKKGIQGGDRGLLQAGGNVVSSFIERANVVAGGSVYADYIVHSNVTASDSVVAKGKRGRLIGGLIRASKEVSAKDLGTPAGEKTLVELGGAPELRGRLGELNAQCIQTKAQLDKINELAKVQAANPRGDADRQAMWQKLLSGREQLQESYEGMLREREAIRIQVEGASDGRVHVTGTAYPDVKITINGAVYTVLSTIEFATFRYHDGTVGLAAYEGD